MRAYILEINKKNLVNLKFCEKKPVYAISCRNKSDTKIQAKHGLCVGCDCKYNSDPLWRRTVLSDLCKGGLWSFMKEDCFVWSFVKEDSDPL